MSPLMLWGSGIFLMFVFLIFILCTNENANNTFTCRRLYCFTFLFALLAVLIFGVAPARATDTIPTQSARYKLELRRQAQYVWGLEAPVSTFAAQLHTESAWRKEALSQAGAQGLAQFMPSTARWISDAYPVLRDNAPSNPTWAMRALVTYDKYLYERVHGATPCERMAFALASYNGGLGWVNKRKRLSPRPEVCFALTCEINPGITAANQRENALYPRRILLRYEPLYRRSGWGPGMCEARSS